LGKKVAVLAVDQHHFIYSSILEIKPMDELVKDENAYIRPSASDTLR
jgi:putative protein kinase ArgK-like GTPase of G3E family